MFEDERPGRSRQLLHRPAGPAGPAAAAHQLALQRLDQRRHEIEQTDSEDGEVLLSLTTRDRVNATVR